MKMNPVVHFEMPAEDRKRMSEFYAKTFGWRTTQLGPEMGDYVLVQTDETDEKGMLKETNAPKEKVWKFPKALQRVKALAE